MTFFVESAFKKQFEILGFNISNLSSSSAFWIFRFYDGTISKIQSTGIEDDEGDAIISFVVSDSFFTKEKSGPLTHQIVLLDSDDQPIHYAEEKNDILISPIQTASELSS